MYIPILLGTNRKDNESSKVADFIFSELENQEDTETNLIKVEDFSFPTVGYGTDIKNQFPEYIEEITKADGILIVVPEYNHGYPGPLKSVLDLLYKEYVHKSVGIVTVSSGGFGGVRVSESLLPVLRALGLIVSTKDLNFSKVGDVDFTDEKLIERTGNFLDELIWLTDTLRKGRE